MRKTVVMKRRKFFTRRVTLLTGQTILGLRSQTALTPEEVKRQRKAERLNKVEQEKAQETEEAESNRDHYYKTLANAVWQSGHRAGASGR